MQDLQKKEAVKGAAPTPAELRRLAAALRARLCFHQQCGITSYPFIAVPQVLSQAAQPQETSASSRKTGQSGRAAQAQEQIAAAENLTQVNQALRACSRCPLAAHSPARVLGRGPSQASFMVVGDYALQEGRQSALEPLCFGQEEDALFWKMMQAIQLGPKDVYVTNVLKCRPVPGKEPEAAWLRQCGLHLVDEIKSLRPHLICAMGEAAAAALLGGSDPVARLRGRVHSLQAGGEAMRRYTVMVTYHPRFLLQVSDMKRAAWEDLQQMQKLLRQGAGTRQ